MEQQDLIVEEFLKDFAELAEHPSIKGDDYSATPYSFFGVINLILLEAIENDTKLAQRIAHWLNSTLNHPETNEYVRDMLRIDFFEGAETNQKYRDFLLAHFSGHTNLLFRQYLYIMEHGGLTDPDTGEILRYVDEGDSVRTGKYITDIT
jgi:hypothetical protein